MQYHHTVITKAMDKQNNTSNAVKIMSVTDKINTDQPDVTKPGYAAVLTGHQEAYCQDLVDHPYCAIMMRVTILC